MNHVRTQENKIKRIFLTVSLFCALGCMFIGAFLLNTPNVARAEVQNLSSGTNASLFLPAAYENYLNLKTPKDAAFCDDYFAIADADTLYVYDRTAHTYKKTSVSSRRTISKIGFTSDGELFVSDTGASNYFYKYSFENNSLQRISSINCSTFCISGDKLYTATISESASISEYSISEIESVSSNPRNLGTLEINTTPSMTILDQKLYCTFGDRAYCVDLTKTETFDENTGSYLSLKPSDATHVQSTCAHNNAFYYTASDGLYRAEFSATGDDAGRATRVLEGKNFGALTSYNGSLYCLRGKSVLRFDPAADGTNYTVSDYEITSASSSVGRLSGAKDIARAGALIAVADADNHRVTVYNSETNTYSVLTPEDDETFSPAFVATDGTLVAAATTEKVYVCNDPVKDPKFETPVPVTNIKGIACVYGKVYYVTQNDIQGELGGTQVNKSNGTPTFMTSDLYGNLYVAYSDHSVRSFTEEQFIAQSADGTKLESMTVPEGAKAMRADFEGGLYYLDSTGKLCGKSGELAAVDGKNFVYLGEDSAYPVSFALGYEDDEVYFLFGDYIVKSKKGTLGFPTLSTIAAEEVYGNVTAPESKEELALYDVHADAVGIRVDLKELEAESEYLPCTDYYRTPAEARGILLSTLGGGKDLLIALYENSRYTVDIFPADRCTEVTPKEGEDGYWQEREETAYLASEGNVYYFPCLVTALAEERLPRGTALKILATVEAEEGAGHTFAYVEYETRARATERGYLPLGMLSPVDPNTPAGENYFFGWLKAREGGVSFLDGSGNELRLEERTYMRFSENEDGTYTAHYTSEGVEYTAQVTGDMFERGESDAWRIALIVGLSVLALLIVGVYMFLLPWGRKKKIDS